MVLTLSAFLKVFFWSSAIVILLIATFYPTDLKRHYAQSKNGHSDPFIVGVEDYGRHINSILPAIAIVVMRDVNGLKQLATIGLTGMIASHGPKRLLNDVTISGTRLGERPSSSSSKHNMPSGHSTLASAGAYFMARRYSHWFGLIVWPVLAMTMYARFMLDAHTISATIAGALTGAIVAALFTRSNTRLK